MAFQRDGDLRATFWFTTDLPRHLAELTAIAPSGMPLEVLPADLTLTELHGIQRLISLDERKLRKQGIRISTVGADVVHNVVEVGLRDPNDDALAILQQRYGPHVTTTVLGPIQEDVGAGPSAAP